MGKFNDKKGVTPPYKSTGGQETWTQEMLEAYLASSEGDKGVFTPPPTAAEIARADDIDKAFYLIAYKEWEENNIDEALWAKYMILNKDDVKKTKSDYLKKRVEGLMNEAEKKARIKANWQCGSG